MEYKSKIVAMLEKIEDDRAIKMIYGFVYGIYREVMK